MGLKAEIIMTEAEAAQVKAILAAHLPPGVRVGVFGSRAGGKPKPWSDLDLVLEGSEPLSWSLLGELADAFDEAPLRWKVDLVDRRSISDAFGRIVDAGRIELVGA